MVCFLDGFRKIVFVWSRLILLGKRKAVSSDFTDCLHIMSHNNNRVFFRLSIFDELPVDTGSSAEHGSSIKIIFGFNCQSAGNAKSLLLTARKTIGPVFYLSQRAALVRATFLDQLFVCFLYPGCVIGNILIN